MKESITSLTVRSYDHINCINDKIPEYFKKTNGKNPTNKDATAFKYAFDTDLHYFEYLAQPERVHELEAFKAHMDVKTLGKKWFQCVDVGNIFDGATDPNGTLMIDIGGAQGHDIIDFYKSFLGIPGQLVLQDLPSIINSLPSNFPQDIEAQAHDMFTPQPIVGAKAYFLHMVLHDWPDDSCRKVLETLRPAMKRDYSKILLNEIVVPDWDANLYSTSIDILMMIVHSAQKRTESDWKRLAESAELKVSKIWDCEGNQEKLIELELA